MRAWPPATKDIDKDTTDQMHTDVDEYPQAKKLSQNFANRHEKSITRKHHDRIDGVIVCTRVSSQTTRPSRARTKLHF